jgi:hypothetical protein
VVLKLITNPRPETPWEAGGRGGRLEGGRGGGWKGDGGGGGWKGAVGGG